MMQNGQQEKALAELRKAREYYKTDPSFHPFFNAVARENMLNEIAYTLLQDKKYMESIQVFELTAEFYQPQCFPIWLKQKKLPFAVGPLPRQFMAWGGGATKEKGNGPAKQRQLGKKLVHVILLFLS